MASSISTSSSLHLLLLMLLFFLLLVHGMPDTAPRLNDKDRSLTLTLISNCGDNIMHPGIQGNAGHKPLANGGFTMEPGNVTVIQVPAGWSGRIWPRTDCDFSRRPSCSAGDCGTQAQCMGAGPQTPVIIAQIAVDEDAGVVIYDINTVDGFDVPMIMEAVPRGGGGGACPTTGCGVDFMKLCPENQLNYWPPGQIGGIKVGCRSLCKDGGGPCDMTDRVKRRCPNLIAYKGDKPQDSLVCGLPAELRLTFCATEVDVISSM